MQHTTRHATYHTACNIQHGIRIICRLSSLLVVAADQRVCAFQSLRAVKGFRLIATGVTAAATSAAFGLACSQCTADLDGCDCCGASHSQRWSVPLL
jgi:hypothetical protein